MSHSYFRLLTMNSARDSPYKLPNLARPRRLCFWFVFSAAFQAWMELRQRTVRCVIHHNQTFYPTLLVFATPVVRTSTVRQWPSDHPWPTCTHGSHKLVLVAAWSWKNFLFPVIEPVLFHTRIELVIHFRVEVTGIEQWTSLAEYFFAQCRVGRHNTMYQ